MDLDLGWTVADPSALLSPAAEKAFLTLSRQHPQDVGDVLFEFCLYGEVETTPAAATGTVLTAAATPSTTSAAR